MIKFILLLIENKNHRCYILHNHFEYFLKKKYLTNIIFLVKKKINLLFQSLLKFSK